MNHSTLTLQLHLAEVLATSQKKEWRNIEKFMTFKVPEDNSKVEVISSKTQESIFSLAYYLEKSDGTHVEKILPYLINCYKYVESLSLNESLRIEDCYAMQFFSKALLEKLFMFAENNCDYKDKINELAWESLTRHTDMFIDISEKETVVNFTKTLLEKLYMYAENNKNESDQAARQNEISKMELVVSHSTLILNGIIQLLQIINCYIDNWSEEYLEKTHELFKTFIKSSSLKTVHAISTYTFQGSKGNLVIIKCLREYRPFFNKRNIIYSGLSQSTLIGLIFKFLKKILMTDIKKAYKEQQKKLGQPIPQERLWNILTYTKIDFTSSFRNETVGEIYQTSIRWFSEYTQFIFNSLSKNNNIAEQDLYAFTTVLKTIVVSALHLKYYGTIIDDDFVNKLKKIILDPNNIPKLPMSVAVLEALGVIMINFDNLQNTISLIIKSFLIQPSISFTKLDNTSITILRQCAADSISLALKAIDNPKLSKAVLVHYCDELYGISKETSGIKTKIYHNVLKAITSIACQINKKEIIDMAVPALTRRLNENEDQINALYCLVEIALTNDATVFRDIINLLSEISKQENYNNNTKVKIIYQCFLIIARTPDLPPKFYELLLENLLFIFVSKTLLLPPKVLKHRQKVDEFTPFYLL